jgi:hypothetical protein
MTEDPPPAVQTPSVIDWPAIRIRYEKGEEAVKDIAAEIHMHWTSLVKMAKAEGWLLRKKVQAKSLSTQATLKRLKDILNSRLIKLEAEIASIGDDIAKLDNEKGYRNLNTLVRTLDKVLELERNDRKSRKAPDTFKHVDDAERAALAGKIERLQQKRPDYPTGGSEDGAGPDSGRSEGAEPPLALLGP